jgi:hypothetical protein
MRGEKSQISVFCRGLAFTGILQIILYYVIQIWLYTFIFYITFIRYHGDFTNYLIENSLVSIALLLTIRPIKYLFNAFINIEITQLNTIEVAAAVGKATVAS